MRSTKHLSHPIKTADNARMSPGNPKIQNRCTMAWKPSLQHHINSATMTLCVRPAPLPPQKMATKADVSTRESQNKQDQSHGLERSLQHLLKPRHNRLCVQPSTSPTPSNLATKADVSTEKSKHKQHQCYGPTLSPTSTKTKTYSIYVAAEPLSLQQY